MFEQSLSPLATQSNPPVFIHYLCSVLLFIWLVTFPGQGILYQITLYCLSALCLINTSTRITLWNTCRIQFDTLLILALPVVLSATINTLSLAIMDHDDLQQALSVDFISEFFQQLFLYLLVLHAFIKNRMTDTERLFRFLFVAIILHNGSILLSSLSDWYITTGETTQNILRAGSSEFSGLLSIFALLIGQHWLARSRDKHRHMMIGASLSIILFSLSLNNQTFIPLCLLACLIFQLLIYIHRARHFGAPLPPHRVWLTAATIGCWSLWQGAIDFTWIDTIPLARWQHFFQVWSDHLFFGVYDPVNHPYFSLADNQYVDSSNNAWLDILVRTGIFGAIVILLVLIPVVKSLYRSQYSIILLPLLLATASSLFFGFTLNSEALSVVALVLAFWLSVVTVPNPRKLPEPLSEGELIESEPLTDSTNSTAYPN